ncbi:MAG: tetratricopeptide repeat protein [Ramlibacter sp.]|nr:tetratricopeptide repeat protein [Ramlibacter sp.]
MDAASTSALQWVQEAWQLFAAGEPQEALLRARQAHASGNPAPQASAALGFFLIQAHREDEAADVLEPALAQTPDHAPLHWYTGYLHQRRGDAAAAAAAFQRACALDGSLDEAAYALAWALHDLGRLDEAAAWAAHALAHRKLPQRWMQMGWLQQQRGFHASAVQAYREAIQTFHSSAAEQARLHLHLSQCLLELGDREEADAALQRALDQWPGDAELLTELIQRLRDRGDPAGARRVARDLVREHSQRAAAWHLLGLVEQDLGDLEEADEALTRAHALDPGFTDALLRRARIQRELQRFAGARWLLDRVLYDEPDNRVALDLLAQVLLDLGELQEARRILLRRLRQQPQALELRRLLAVAQWRRGRAWMAQRTLRQVLAAAPHHIEALRMQGWLALDLGHTTLAVETLRVLLTRLPGDSAAQVQAAFVFAHANQIAEAQGWAERAVAHAPDSAEAWRALSEVRLRQRRLADAELAVAHALRLAPDRVDGLRQMGWVMLNAARPAQAQLAFLRAIECSPADPVPRLELAEAQRRSGQFDLALSGVQDLLAERADWLPAWLLKARLLTESGHEEALEACARLLRRDRSSPDAIKAVLRLAGLGDHGARALLRLVPVERLRGALREALQEAVYTQGPGCLGALTRIAREDLDDDPWTGAAALYGASLDPRSDLPTLALQARQWYRSLKVRSGLARLPATRKALELDARPRIAYVAGQLHQSLLRRVLAAHAGDRAQVFVYTNQPCPDLPSHIHLQPLMVETLAESCAANRIDVVIDAGGLHPFEGQFALLQAYARRLAPVQVGWLGCWGPSGGLFDVLLADEASVPEGHEGGYDEAIRRLQGGQWCWDPPAMAPPVSPAPLIARGTVTFGVTARSLRLSADYLDACARIVGGTPGSAIRFIGEVAGDWPLRRVILSRMQACGVVAGRVYFHPFMPRADYLAWFGQVDLVLDSFPGNGGLSLLDPLWMGVPVVTLAGPWAGARQGLSVLASLGLAGWSAETLDGFCALACRMAGDPTGLRAHRASLRQRIFESPLVDGLRVASQIEAICAQLKQSCAGLSTAGSVKRRTQWRAQIALQEWLQRPRAIDLATAGTSAPPDLSVIVVLFNQAGLSQRTFQALADQRDVSFETIVVDNASHDRTPDLLACLRGARVIRNAQNLGFLQAARQGADAARGRYLVFLNSDAVLLEGALAHARDAMEADASIGALGGRVVLTDGGLQEAGNVVFDNGLAGGIGRGEDPFGHAALSARATDYVSGVLLVTPAAVWRMLGGFDEAFVPAYYEDTDYCLRVWQAGLRVVYEPSVLLEHLEWGSATGDSATELMERNRSVFRSRHAAWLKGQPPPQALPLDGDKWRSPKDRERRPRVLFVENEVPHMFKGGGLPRARLMLQALRDWPLTLFPLWTLHDDWRAVYASIPRSVEVALGHGLAGLEAFLERRRGVYDILMVSRPPNLQALQPLRQRRPDLFAGMQLVYDAEALFALREIAMAGVQGHPLTRQAAQARIGAEMALAAGARDVLVVSGRDAGYFEAAGHRVCTLSHSIPVRRHAPGVARRSGLLFVGALHPGTPNEDGLLWFLREVMPLLRERLPSPPHLTVVGVCLSDKVAAQAGPEVSILGPQEALEPHYDAARVFIAPVRFAGGVPAKVIEAAASGIPTVASALLVRQLAWRDGLDIVGARDARTFAMAIARLLLDDGAWERQQAAAWEQCDSRYHPDLFARNLRGVLQRAAARDSRV